MLGACRLGTRLQLQSHRFFWVTQHRLRLTTMAGMERDGNQSFHFGTEHSINSTKRSTIPPYEQITRKAITLPSWQKFIGTPAISFPISWSCAAGQANENCLLQNCEPSPGVLFESSRLWWRQRPVGLACWRFFTVSCSCRLAVIIEELAF